MTTRTETEATEPATVPTCAECGSTTFRRWESGDYSERHTLDFAPTGEAAHDWDKQDTTIQDSEPWACINGHEANDDLADRLYEA